MYTEAEIEVMLTHFLEKGWLTVIEAEEIRTHFNTCRQEGRLSIWEVEAVVDIEYKITSLDYALSLIENKSI